MRAIAVVLFVLTGCQSPPAPPGRTALELPAGGRYQEAVLTSQVRTGSGYKSYAVLYEVRLELRPGRSLLLVGERGGEEFRARPFFQALQRPALLLAASPTGHALAWSATGDHWSGVWLDGPEPFFCSHVDVSPGQLQPTAEVVREILTSSRHWDVPTLYPVDSMQSSEAGAELRGALRFALSSKEPGLFDLAIGWIVDQKHAELVTRYSLSVERLYAVEGE